jgi:hypothetical protein
MKEVATRGVFTPDGVTPGAVVALSQQLHKHTTQHAETAANMQVTHDTALSVAYGHALLPMLSPHSRHNCTRQVIEDCYYSVLEQRNKESGQGFGRHTDTPNCGVALAGDDTWPQ